MTLYDKYAFSGRKTNCPFFLIARITLIENPGLRRVFFNIMLKITYYVISIQNHWIIVLCDSFSKNIDLPNLKIAGMKSTF